MIAEYNQKRIFVIVWLSFSSMDPRQTTDSLSSCSDEQRGWCFSAFGERNDPCDFILSQVTKFKNKLFKLNFTITDLLIHLTLKVV